VTLLAPKAENRKGEFRDLFESVRRRGIFDPSGKAMAAVSSASGSTTRAEGRDCAGRSRRNRSMDARRARVIAGSAILLGVLAIGLAAPASAADCALSAPAYVNVGTALSIEGSGFPASTSVDIALSIRAVDPDALPSERRTGPLQIALTPEDIDIGETTVTATAGTACTASVTYTVLAAGATPPPATPEDAPTAPRTDGLVVGGEGGAGGATGLLALILVALGGAGLFLTRSPRGR
jgi:hypothetical protein